MSANEIEDSAQRQRDAVLDALLADPALSQPDSVPDAPEPPVFASAGQRERPAPRLDDLEAGRASDHIHALLGRTVAPAYGSEPGDLAAHAARRRPNSEAAAPQMDSDGMDGVLKPPSVVRPGTRNLGPVAALAAPLLRRPRLMAAGAGALAVLLLIIVLTGGRDDTRESPAVATAAPAPPVATAPAGPTSAVPTGGRQVTVRSVDTQCPTGSTDAMDAFSGEPGKAWSCVRAYDLDGQLMVINLDKPYAIDSIGIVPGWDFVDAGGADQWTKHRTVSRVSYEFSDRTQTVYTQETMDQRKLVVTKVEPPITTDTIALTVLKSSGDRSITQTAISQVVITGR